MYFSLTNFNFKKTKFINIVFIVFSFLFLITLFNNEKSSTKIKINLDVTEQNNDEKLAICLNSITPKNEYALASLAVASDDPRYLLLARKFIRSVIDNTKGVKYDKILIELTEKPFNNEQRNNLFLSGWDFICTIERIPLINETFETPKNYKDVFAKLIYFNMTQYKSVVAIDTDTLVVGDLSDLFHFHEKIDYKTIYIGAVRDTDALGVALTTLNTGVLTIKPNTTEFNRLIYLKENNSTNIDKILPEQSFLNTWYKDKWFNFGIDYNLMTNFLKNNKDYYKENKANVKILHYTYWKPWNCVPECEDVCKLWFDAPS